ncbi:MAG: hypothetical protein AAGC55_24840, partial [Myxococcota bacterium]
STVHRIGYMQWSYADFQIIGYDNSLATDATLEFEFKGFNVGDIQLDGELTLDQVLDDGGGMGNKLDIVGALKKGYKAYKDVDSAKDALKKFRDKNPGKWYSNAISSILNSGISNFASPLGGIVGVVSSFISGGKSAHTAPLKFKGDINFEGTLTTSFFLFDFDIRAPGAPLSNPFDSKRPDYTSPLGIFNVVSKPTMYWLWVDVCNFAPDQPKKYETLIPGGGGGGGGGNDCSFGYRYKLSSPLQVITNPVLSGKVSITMGVIWPNLTTYYTSLSSYNSTQERVSDLLFGDIAIKARVNTNNPGQPPVYIVNTYKVNKQYKWNL